MKNIFESGEVMGIYSELDFYYYRIAQLERELNKSRSPIEIMIDGATGADVENSIKIKNEVIVFLKNIIECKKKIEADYVAEEKLIQNLQTLFR